MPEKGNARRVRAGAAKAVRRFAANDTDGPAGTQALSAADWIQAIEVADRVFGRWAAVALWRESPLPNMEQLPAIELRFIEECVIRQPGGSLMSAELFGVYRQWCFAQGLAPVSASSFGRTMTRLGFVRVKSSRMKYRGIGLRCRPVDGRLPIEGSARWVP